MAVKDDIAVKPRARIIPEEPRRFQVILSQQPCPMYFHGTTSTLREIFKMAYDESHHYAKKASLTGKAIVFIGTKDIVETKVSAANERLSGFSSTAQSAIEFKPEPL